MVVTENWMLYIVGACLVSQTRLLNDGVISLLFMYIG